MDAPRYLTPSLDLLRQEFVLVQAWKKTSAYIRAHNWYADTLQLDRATVNLPRFLSDLSKRLTQPADWKNDALRLVPAPKSQEWHISPDTKQWEPVKPAEAAKKLRPLAHASLADQVMATAVMMCLADRVETRQGDPKGSISKEADRRQIISYGNRLFCDEEEGFLHHRWGAGKLYRGFYHDYRRFLSRPDQVAESLAINGTKVVIVQSDLRQFYDRVRPALLAKKIDALAREGDDPRFFDFAKRLLNWEWNGRDRRDIEAYARRSGLIDFSTVALPQGLVAAGFYANVVLLDFDGALSTAIGREISPGLHLADACRYVDDLRLVLTVGENTDFKDIEIRVHDWLQDQLDKHAPGLAVSQEKTIATTFGGDERALVRQSRKMQRIQRAVSGGFDAVAGEEILDAVQGLLRSQQQFSDRSLETSGWAFSPIPDVKDATVARFAAGRFRSTYRSLRPLLREDDDTGQVKPASDDQTEHSRVARTQRELDDDARTFALGLVERWIYDPSNVRLLRIGLDIWPADDVLKEVLALIRPFTKPGGRRKEPRRVAWYCLAEIFRAGATETGFVESPESFPQELKLADYRALLRTEALRLTALPPASLPWYLKQQILLFLAASDPEGVPVYRKGRSGETKHYRELIQFLRGDLDQLTGSEFATLAVLSRRSFFNQASALEEVGRLITVHQLECLAELDPTFALEIMALRVDLAEKVSPRVRDDLCLNPAITRSGPTTLAQIVFGGGDEGPLRNEIGLLNFAVKFLQVWATIEKSEVVTPVDVLLKSENESGSLGHDYTLSIAQSRTGPNGSLYRPPLWCQTEERWRFQLGYLLRFVLTAKADFSRPVRAPQWREGKDIYRPPENHWYQRHHGFFNGHSSFGNDWLPISDWIESFLSALLHWPGCRPTPMFETVQAGLAATRKIAEERLQIVSSYRGDLTGTLMLPLRATSPVKGNAIRPLRGCVVQTVIPRPQEFSATDLTCSANAIRKQHRNHLSSALAAIERMLDLRETHRERDGRLDWLILPELSVHPDDVKTHLIPFARAHKTIVLAGLTFEELVIGQPLVNSAIWIVPAWSPTYGLQILTRRQGKQHLAPLEAKFNEPTPKIRGFRPCQWIVGYEWSPLPSDTPLKLTAAVCYDATDIRLAGDLRDRSDVFAIPALNIDVGTFDQMAQALHYHMYQMVVVANNGEFGGSNAYAPYKDHFRKQVFHLHGQPQASIAFFEIDDIREFIDRGAPSSASVADTSDQKAPKWKFPPAGRTA